MILDTNAGNQTMWKYKEWDGIIHIDFNKKLTVKPMIWCSNICMPFADQTFDQIFADPPHFYGDKGSIYAYPDMETFTQKFQGYGSIPRYYGGDIYKNQSELLHYVHNLQKECYRVLKDSGTLLLKWNESMIHMGTIMALFEDWHELLDMPIKLNNPNRTDKQTYWKVLCKKKKIVRQASLF